MSMRSTICGLIWTLAAASFAAPVSLTVPTSDVPTVLKAITEATGEPHTCSGFDREFLTVIVTDVEPEELRTKIAFVLDAEWEENNKVFRLTRSRELREERKARDLDELARRYREEIQKFPSLQDLPTKETILKEALDSADTSDREALARLLRLPNCLFGSVLASFDASTLIDIPVNQPVVFSTRPTRAQARMPSRVRRTIDEFTQYDRMRRDMPVPYNAPFFPGSEFIIQVRRDGENDLTIDLYQYRPSELYRAESFQKTLHIDREIISLRTYSSSVSDNDKESHPLPAAESSLNLNYLDEMMFAGHSSMFQQYFNENRFQQKYLNDVLEQEPYRFIWDGALKATASERHWNVVAVPTLQSWGSVRTAVSKSKYVPSVANWLDQAAEIDDGWCLMRPEFGVDFRSAEPSRTSVRRLLAETLVHKNHMIDPISDYVANNGSESFDTIGATLQSSLAQQGISCLTTSDTYYEDGAFRTFTGALSNDNMARLQSGLRLRLGDLPVDIQERAYKWTRIQGLHDSSVEERLQVGYGQYDVTLTYPDGLPPDTIVSLSARENTSFCCLYRLDSGGEEWRYTAVNVASDGFFSPKQGARIVGFHRNVLVVRFYIITTPEGLSLRAAELVPQCTFPHVAVSFNELSEADRARLEGYRRLTEPEQADPKAVL